MQERSNDPQGVCEGCGKAYRVPSAERTYRCKACGGTVRVGAGTPPAPGLDETCPSCQAVVVGDSDYCEECGAPLSRAAVEDEKEKRLGASRDMHKALKRIRQLRRLFALFGVLAGFAAVGLFASALAASRLEDRSEALVLMLLTVMQGGVAAVAVTAAIRIDREPFLWALLMACIQTLLVVMGIAFGAVGICPFLFAVTFWGGVVAIAPVKRLVEEYPDLRVARRLKGETPRRAVSSTARRSRAPRASERRSGRRPVPIVPIVAGAVVLALAGLWLGVHLLNRPPAMETVVGEFTAAWNDQGLPAAVVFFPEESREERRETLRLDVAARGWRGVPEPLSLEGSETVEKGEKRVVKFPFGDDELRTVWEAESGDWVLRELRLPIGELPERFRATWDRSDVEGVAAFYRDPVKASGVLHRFIEGREWESLPRLESVRQVEQASTIVKLYCDTERGAMEFTWQFKEDRWVLRSFKPPERT